MSAIPSIPSLPSIGGPGVRGTEGAAPFTPASVAGLALWLKADAGLYQDSAQTTPATADTHPVGGWQDQSGNGRHVLQATALNRPLLKLAIQNGLPVVRYDGSNDFLQAAFASIPQPITILLVANYTSATINRWMYSDAGTNLLKLQNASPNLLANAGANLSYAQTLPTGWAQWTILHSGLASNFWKDGVLKAGPATSGTNGLAGFTLGAAANGTTGAGMDVGEVLIYGADVTADRAALETYLKGRWGTP